MKKKYKPKEKNIENIQIYLQKRNLLIIKTEKK